MSNITEGLVLAGFDTICSSFEHLISDETKQKEKIINKFSLNTRPGLTCYGAEIIKPSLLKNGLQLHQKATKKLCNVYDKYHILGKPIYQDSGGFQICKNYAKPEYCESLAKYYSDFIQDMSSNPKYNDMLFFYLDLVTTNGITKEISTKYMLEFQKQLMEKTKNSKGHENVYLVIQSNNEIVYDTFYHFIRDNGIHEQLNSHKWAVGGLVVINFNDDQYKVRPYMIGLFDMLDLELDNLKKGIPVYFHILGTSSYYEMILIAWMSILCEYYELPLVFTFDSTTHINNVSKAGRLHYYDETNEEFPFTTIDTKEKDLYKIVPNRNGLMNVDYLNKVKNEIISEFDLDETDWFDKNGRWASQASNSMMIYEAYAFGQLYPYIKKVSYEKRDWIINDHTELKYLMVNLILEKIDYTFKTSCYKPSFDRKVMEKIIRSLEWFELAIKNKLPNERKSFQLVHDMCSQNRFLASGSSDDVTKSDFYKI